MKTHQARLQEIRNFQAIGERLGTSGMPAPDQFALIARAGYQVVINLAANETSGQISDEDEIVASLGMTYISIPVIWESPQQEELDRFFRAMEAYSEQHVFIHCVANYRASVFVALFRILRLAEEPEQAMTDLQRIWIPEGVWVKFIQDALLRG